MKLVDLLALQHSSMQTQTQQLGASSLLCHQAVDACNYNALPAYDQDGQEAIDSEQQSKVQAAQIQLRKVCTSKHQARESSQETLDSGTAL